jgi:hypothetical protein
MRYVVYVRKRQPGRDYLLNIEEVSYSTSHTEPEFRRSSMHFILETA